MTKEETEILWGKIQGLPDEEKRRLKETVFNMMFGYLNSTSSVLTFNHVRDSFHEYIKIAAPKETPETKEN